MMKPKFQSCSASRAFTTPSTRSSPTSSPATMVRLTWAPSLVWCCTFQRKISPTLICTRSRSSASIVAWVPLPLPCTPMMTYLRMTQPWHAAAALAALGHPEHQLAADDPSCVPAFATRKLVNRRSHHLRRLGSSEPRMTGQSSLSRPGLRKRATSLRRPWVSTTPYMLRRSPASERSNSRIPGQDRCRGRTMTPRAGPRNSSSRCGSRPAGLFRPVSRSASDMSPIMSDRRSLPGGGPRNAARRGTRSGRR